jgi:Family of unknown function (DUF6186)
MTRFLVISVFLLSVVIGLVIGYLASRPGSRIPRLGDIAGAVMRYDVGGLPVGRLALLGFWFWCGWHFLAR